MATEAVRDITKGLSSREAARGHATSVDGVLVTVTKFRINNFNKLLFPVDHMMHSYCVCARCYLASSFVQDARLLHACTE